MSVTVSPIKDGDDEVVAVVATMRDLSVPATRGGEQRSAGSYHVTPAVFCKADAGLDACVVVVDSCIVYASQRALAVVGARSSAQVVGRDVFDFIAPGSVRSSV